jgi:hypothetical protein
MGKSAMLSVGKKKKKRRHICLTKNNFPEKTNGVNPTISTVLERF